jgi:putative ABC transport system substrate-binding protein
MRRREFITMLGGAAVWPRVGHAQQTALPVIGFLSVVSPAQFEQRLAGFRQGLNETGYVEGQNLTVENRWAEGRYDQLPALAAELVDRRVGVIVAYTDAAALAAKAATRTIPIVFLNGDDPVKLGLVSSLNRPGENITGVSWFGVDLGPKQLSLLHELVPNAAVIALLLDQNVPDAASQATQVQEAARTLGLQITVLNARTDSDVDAAFATLMQARAGSLIVGAGASLVNRRGQIIALAKRHAIPTIYGFREYAVDGGLISYGNSVPNAFRQAGIYTGRILKGAKPADLPVVQVSKFELVINRKTAQELGLKISGDLLSIADEVIE